MKQLIRFAPVAHVAMSVQHKGNDQQYCEAGETVRLNWQPSSGWGLQEAHYTDDQDQVVQIDLSTREFTMPDYDIEIEGTAKRFTVQDWTSGTDAADNAGKVLGFDNKGQLVPVEAGGGGDFDPQDWNGEDCSVLMYNKNTGKTFVLEGINYSTSYGALVISAPANEDLIIRGSVVETAYIFNNGDAVHFNASLIEFGAGALCIYSPNGTLYRLKVADDGTLSTELVS